MVIPTLNRAQAIADLVDDLLKQQHPVFTIIVVDQTTAINTALSSLAANEPRLKIIRPDVVGTCHARNAGVAAAPGEIIVFCDDDCRLPNTDFLAGHAKNYTDEKVGGVAGRIIDKNETLNREQSGPVCRVTATGKVYGNASSGVRQDVNAPRGANMSFRRAVIVQVGGFDEQFRGNAMREETDFSLRVVKAGWQIVYDPEIPVTHLGLSGGSRSSDRLRWYRDFFFNESYFFLKHFSSILLPLLFLRKLRAIIACWIWYGHGKFSWFIAPWRSFAEARRLVRIKT